LGLFRVSLGVVVDSGFVGLGNIRAALTIVQLNKLTRNPDQEISRNGSANEKEEKTNAAWTSGPG